mmetsp:Transcript_61042/g.176813  ORF Transcript_61042/g.176813 Transcript_61042/m.176813 type:complete len:944 (-) Transcript_61042:67-2898(-)
MPSSCGIRGCERCDEHLNKCLECVKSPHLLKFLPEPGFVLTDGGNCYLPMDTWMSHVGAGLTGMLVLLLLGAIVVQMTIVLSQRHRRMKEIQAATKVEEEVSAQANEPLVEAPKNPAPKDPTTDEERQDRSSRAIRHALTAWLQRQMRDWELKTHKNPSRYSCMTNLSNTYVMGVGLPLFYGFKVLVGVSAVLSAATLVIVQRRSGVEPLIRAAIHDSESNEGREAFQKLKSRDLENYAEDMFIAISFLYVLLLTVSLYHYYRQRKFVGEFDAGNSCMRDFSIHFRSLPRDMVEEGRLKAIVEQQFQCKGEVLGVSIGYDLSKPDVGSKVFDMVEHRLVLADVEYHEKQMPLHAQGWGYPSKLAKEDHMDMSRDRKEFRKMWDDGKLQSSGHAFVVFKKKGYCSAAQYKYRAMWIHTTIIPTAAEVNALQKAWTERFRGHLRDTTRPESQDEKDRQREYRALRRAVMVGGTRLNEGSRIYNPDGLKADTKIEVEAIAKIIDDTLEPTSTLWFNFGITEEDTSRNGQRYVLIMASVFLLIVIAIYFPLFAYLIAPCGQANVSPSLISSQLVGMLLAIAQNVMGVVNWNACGAIGYFSIPRRDQNFVNFSTAINFLNSTLFISAGLSYYLEKGFNRVDLVHTERNQVEDLQRERSLFDAFYNMLMPGWLFAGVLTGKLMGWFMPVIQNFVLTHAVFTMNCLPRPICVLLTKFIPWNPELGWLAARQAEHVFEPPELALAWEYNMFIVTPCVCNFALFVISPRSWKVFALLAMWVAVMYLVHRYPTLLISRKYTTDHNIDLLACKFWGIPLSMVLAAAGFWGLRAGYLGDPAYKGSYWIIVFMFLLGVTLHRLALELLGGATHDGVGVEQDDSEYTQVQQKLRYSWFNTNPVHILKSCYYPEKLGNDMADTQVYVPFEFGKEYLQVSSQEGALSPPSCAPGSRGAP